MDMRMDIRGACIGGAVVDQRFVGAKKKSPASRQAIAF
jgi:hypothetical protein